MNTLKNNHHLSKHTTDMMKRFLSVAFVAATALATLPATAVATGTATVAGTQDEMLPYQNPALSPRERAEDLCARLTLEEKTALMMDRSPAIPRLGIPQFEWWNEALHGVGRNGFATVFPITVGMAAAWDDALLYRVFDAVSDEARAKNTDARRRGDMTRYRGLSFWTPNINIFRDPRWGRGQETYGEDPYLTTCMGLAVVAGLQGQAFTAADGTAMQSATIADITSASARKYAKLYACAKHYAVHSGPEWNRHSFNIEDLPERDLWETYMPAFKALVQQGNVKEVMCAYQRIDGEPCCGNKRYMQRILRDEWGFQGIVTSDCGGIRDFHSKGAHEWVKTREEATARAIITGTDVECGSVYQSLPEAVKQGLITEEQVNVSLKRLLEARFELGDFDRDELVEWTKIPMSVVASKEHKQLALDMARETMVLLKNNGVLPLSPNSKIAVMGPNANDSVMLWGNYSGMPTSSVTLLQGIRNIAPQAIFMQGCGHTRNEVFDSRFNELRTPDGQSGVRATYWNNEEWQGTPAATAVHTAAIHLDNGGNTVFAPGVNLEHFSAKYETVFTPSTDQEIMINLDGEEFLRIVFDGDTLFGKWNGHGTVSKQFRKQVKAGHSYPITVDYVQRLGLAYFGFDVASKTTPALQDVLNAVKDADVVVFAGGISPKLEGEEMKVSEEGFRGGDRTRIDLPQVQCDMVKALKQAGKQVVFVNCSGAAMAFNDAEPASDAILQAWYGGEQGGTAVADVLFGRYNPSGKLPITFYKSTDQLPDFLDYTMQGHTYRYFRGQPQYAFGHGLSYTTFDISRPKWKNGAVSVTVRNTGKREGTETVQVYLRKTDDADGPNKTLRAYRRVTLPAGGSQTITIPMPREKFEWWDKATNTMRPLAGKYEVMVGNASDCTQSVMVNIK